MRWFFGLLVGFAAVAILFPILEAEAQDAKTEEKKDDDKKPVEKKVVRPDETTVLASVKKIYKIKNVKTDPDKELTLVAYDPLKVAAFNQWDAKAQQAAKKDMAKNAKDKDYPAARRGKYMSDRDKEYDKVFTGEEVSAYISDQCRFRATEIPPKLNKNGEPEKLTRTELANHGSALKGGSKLPGYPVPFESLRQGQVVEVYLPKATAKKDAPAVKKGPIGADPALGGGSPTVQPLLLLIKEEPH